MKISAEDEVHCYKNFLLEFCKDVVDLSLYLKEILCVLERFQVDDMFQTFGKINLK